MQLDSCKIMRMIMLMMDHGKDIDDDDYDDNNQVEMNDYDYDDI